MTPFPPMHTPPPLKKAFSYSQLGSLNILHDDTRFCPCLWPPKFLSFPTQSGTKPLLVFFSEIDPIKESTPSFLCLNPKWHGDRGGARLRRMGSVAWVGF
jgi:hypothetical protein